MAFDPNDEDDVKLLALAVEKAVNEGTSGLKNKNQELIAAEKKLKDRIRELTDSTGGMDVEKLKELQKRLETDEEARMISEGRTQEVIDRRTKLMRDKHEKDLKDANDRADSNLKYATKFRDATLSSAVRDAAIKAGVEPTAVDDIVLRAKASGFGVDDDGNPVMLDGKGEPVIGKDGASKLQPLEWVEGLREKAPHLWPKAAGGGAGGGGQAPDSKKKFAELTEAERTALYRENPQEFERRKKAG